MAKTLLVSTLSQTLHLSFKRIQFTPDLMPSDITGTEIIYQDPASNERQFRFLKGRIFANMILADEINRTRPRPRPPCLRPCRNGRSQSVAPTTLPDPFFVLATQNPIEQEGTYPLPEAQLDRFMFMIVVDYPSSEEELQIMKMATGVAPGKPQSVLTAEDIVNLQQVVRRMPVADHIYTYAERLVRVTRPEGSYRPGFLQKMAYLGCRPARWPQPDSRRQSTCHAPWANLCELRRRGGRGTPYFPAPYHSEFCRPE